MPRTQRESLHALMTAYVDGDNRAFARLYRRVLPVMRRRLGDLVADPGLAADVLQSAFLRAHEARHRFDLARSGDATVVAWYVAIARNTALDRLRRITRRSQREAKSGHLVHTTRYAPYAASETPELLAVDTETGRECRLWVRAALHSLSHRDRELLVDHKLRGRTLAELAQTQGIPAVTMRVRAHRAYRRLVTALRGGAPELFGEPAAADYDRGRWDPSLAAPLALSSSPSA